MRRALIPTVIAVATLAGCAGTVSTVTYPFPYTSSAARVYLQDAATRGPMLLQVRDNPFPEDVARPIAEAASRTSIGISVRFTANPAEAAKPDYWMVVQFDPEPGASSAGVCDPRRPVGRASSPGRLNALVVFCHASGPILSLTAQAPRPEHADSPIIRELTEQAMLRMFTPEPQDRDNRRWFLLGSM